MSTDYKRLDPKDPKADAFMTVVVDKLAMPKNKVLVFSTFRHTLRYLVAKLKVADVRFGLVHGGVPDEERANLRRRFALPKEHPDALDVLMSSEVWPLRQAKVGSLVQVAEGLHCRRGLQVARSR